MTTATLTDQWKEAKTNEKAWAEARVQIESAIYEANQQHITDKGTFTTEDGMKIATGYTDKWSQEELAVVAAQWPTIANVPFPFELEYKPVAKSIAFIKENMPEAYKRIGEALTQTPKKPAFSVKD